MLFCCARRQDDSSMSLHWEPQLSGLLSLAGVENMSFPQFTHLQTGIYGVVPSNHSQDVNILTTTSNPWFVAAALQITLPFRKDMLCEYSV